MAGDGAATLADEFRYLCEVIGEIKSQKSSGLSREDLQTIVKGLKDVEEVCRGGALSPVNRLLVVRRMCSTIRLSIEQIL